MDLSTFEALLSNGQMETAARDLGRNFAATDASNLRELQRVIARATPPDGEATGDTFARGFLQALAMVTSGFEDECSQRDDAAADLSAARSRTHWTAVLEAIDDGCVTPGDIAATAEIDASTVSRVLGAMERRYLLMRRDPAAGEDGRTRPFALTPRGKDLCERLFRSTEASIDDLVRSVVAGAALLFVHGCVSRTAIRDACHDNLDDERAEHVADSIVRVLVDTGLGVVDHDETIFAPVVELHRQFDSVLTDALRAPMQPPPGIVNLLAQLADGETLYFRTSSRFNEWDVLVRRFGLATVRVFREDEGLPEPVAGRAYRVLYESREVLARDQDRYGVRLDAVLREASACSVLDIGFQRPVLDRARAGDDDEAPEPESYRIQYAVAAAVDATPEAVKDPWPPSPLRPERPAEFVPLPFTSQHLSSTQHATGASCGDN